MGSGRGEQDIGFLSYWVDLYRWGMDKDSTVGLSLSVHLREIL